MALWPLQGLLYRLGGAENLRQSRTITGSIGVIAQFTNFEELFKKIGFRMEVVKSGAFKDVGNPGRAMTARSGSTCKSS